MPEVRVTEDKGKALFSTSDFQRGDTILTEEYPICSISLIPLNVDDEYKFNPFREHELALISEMCDDVRPVTLALLAARCFETARISNEFAEKIKVLCKPTSILHSKYKGKLQMNAKIAKHLLRCLSIEVPEDECFDLVCKLSCNLFTIVDSDLNPRGAGIYPSAAVINHSCTPNATPKFEGQKLSVVCNISQITCNTEICIAYTNTSKSAWCRRLDLLTHYFFLCGCERCKQSDTIDNIKCISCSKYCQITVENDGPTPGDDQRFLELLPSMNAGSEAQNSSAWVMLSFLDDLSFPCGDIFMQQFLQVDLQSWIASSELDGIISDKISFKCHDCNSNRSSLPIFGEIRKLYTLWSQLLTIEDSPSSNSAIALRRLQSKAKIWEQILEIMQSELVIDTHYSVAHTSDRLVTNLLTMCNVYDDLLAMSPGNKKLREGRDQCMQKYLLYAKALETALPVCL